jgi:PAS domain S-box-containing protein
MKLRSKTLIYSGIIITVLILILLLISQFVFLSTSTDYEQRYSNHVLKDELTGLNQTIFAMNETARDWSQWDDAYDYLSGNNPSFATNDLSLDTFARLDLNLIMYIDTNGTIKYGKAYNHENNEFVSLPGNLSSFNNESQILQSNNMQGYYGLLNLPEGPMIIISKPVLTSHDKGPSPGTLIMGRYLTPAELNKLINIPNSTLSIQGYSTADASPEFKTILPKLSNSTPTTFKVLGGNSIAAYGLLNDIYGNPSIIVKSEMARTLYHAYLNIVYYFVGSLLLVGILFVILALYVLDKNLLNRLDKLMAEIVDIGKKGDIKRRVTVSGDDELGDLASTINSSLFSLQKFEKDLETSEKKYRNIFENTGTAMLIAEDDLTISLVNKTFENMLGLKKSDIVGNNWIDLIVPEQRAEVQKHHIFPSEDSTSQMNLKTYDVEIRINEESKYFFATFDFIPGTQKSLISLIDITDRKIAETLLKSSLKEKELLLREIHHRVKNSLQIVASLLSLQASEFNDPIVKESYSESENRIHSIALVHEILYNSTDISEISIREYIEALIENILYSYDVDTQKITLDMDVEDQDLAIETSIPLGLIINELVSNSIKHAFKDGTGKIELKLTKLGDEYELKLGDNGVGLPEDFDIVTTTTLGIILVNELVNQLDGSIEVIVNQGTQFIIHFKEQKYKKRL